jgi:hypothetical protein
MESESNTTTLQKAMMINRATSIFGTVAEIGAGQEVARQFFQAGGAAGTIAKSTSAYDMTFSDAIYGVEESGRYVSESRLMKMLDREYRVLLERLSDSRKNTTFFAFADTVAATSYSYRRVSHGWMGIRGQLYPNAEPSQIVLHVRMQDKENLQQQEALGILGVNLIYGMYHHYRNPAMLIESLTDNLVWGRVEIDMIEFTGPYFDELDNRLMNLHLVRTSLTDAIMFSPEGEVVEAAEVLYKKNVLAIRGSFRPLTNVHVDMLRCGEDYFTREPNVDPANLVIMAEITMAQLMIENGEIVVEDFLARVDNLVSLGYSVLISNYLRYFRIQTFFRRYTNRMIGIIAGIQNIRDIFDERYYEGLPGGILEALGHLFSGNIRLYVYPCLSPGGDDLVTADDPEIKPGLKLLYDYLKENGNIAGMEGCDREILKINHEELLHAVHANLPGWEKMVPETVAQHIQNKKLFGFDTE